MNWGAISVFAGLLVLAATSPPLLGLAIVAGLVWLFVRS